MGNHKYYYIKSKRLASAIHFISSLPYKIFDNNENSSIKTYAFEDTDKFREILCEVSELRKKYQ